MWCARMFGVGELPPFAEQLPTERIGKPIVIAPGNEPPRRSGGSLFSRPGGYRMDALRVARLMELVKSGVPRGEAFWKVISAPDIGRKSEIERAARGGRPTPSQLEARCGALLARAAPGVITTALAEAKSFLASQATATAMELAKNATRTAQDKDTASGVGAQTKAAELLFRVLGAIGQSGSQQVNTQVNVALADESVRQRAAEILAGKAYKAKRIEDELPPAADESAS